MAHGPWTHNTIFQMSLIGAEANQQIVNVHHFEATQALETTLVSDAEAIAACQTLNTAWLADALPSWLACHDTGYQITMLRTQVIERPANRNHKLTANEQALAGGNTGIEPGGSDALSSAAVIKWRSVVANRHSRGRSYVGPVPTSFFDAGRLSNVGPQKYGDYATAMVSKYGATAGTNLNFRLTIYSRPFDKGQYGYPQGQHPNKTFFYPDDYVGNSNQVTAGLVDTVVRTQRRREYGVGA